MQLCYFFCRIVCRFADFFCCCEGSATERQSCGENPCSGDWPFAGLWKNEKKDWRTRFTASLMLSRVRRIMKVLFTLCEKINEVSDYFHCLIDHLVFPGNSSKNPRSLLSSCELWILFGPCCCSSIISLVFPGVKSKRIF